MVRVYISGSTDSYDNGAWVVHVPKINIVSSGVDTETTVNRMELEAIKNGISYILENHSGVGKIITDSSYIDKLMNGTRKLSRNLDLWSEIEYLMKRCKKLVFIKIRKSNVNIEHDDASHAYIARVYVRDLIKNNPHKKYKDD